MSAKPLTRNAMRPESAGELLRVAGMPIKRAADREFVTELRADADRGVRRRARTELEGRRQPPVPQRHVLCTRSNDPSCEPAREAHADLSSRGSAHMHDELATAQRLADMDRRLRRRGAATRSRFTRARARAGRSPGAEVRDRRSFFYRRYPQRATFGGARRRARNGFMVIDRDLLGGHRRLIARGVGRDERECVRAVGKLGSRQRQGLCSGGREGRAGRT